MSFTGSGRFSGGRRRGRHFLGRAGVSRSPPPAGPRTSRKGYCLEIAEGGGSRHVGGDTGGGAAEAGDSGLAGGGCGDQRAKGSPLQAARRGDKLPRGTGPAAGSCAVPAAIFSRLPSHRGHVEPGQGLSPCRQGADLPRLTASSGPGDRPSHARCLPGLIPKLRIRYIIMENALVGYAAFFTPPTTFDSSFQLNFCRFLGS